MADPDTDRPSEQAPPAPRKADFAQTARAVGWSFLGIRRASGLERDARLNPLHVVIAAVVGVALFILALVLLVHWVTQSGVAR